MSRKQVFQAGEGNLFQRIKVQVEAASIAGVEVIPLTIGEPAGPALEAARHAASTAILSTEEPMHNYQDCRSQGCPDFAKEFARFHVGDVVDRDDVDFLSLKGIKASLRFVINAMGGFCRTAGRPVKVATMTAPGYPTPREECLRAVGVEHIEIPLDPKRGFLFHPTWVMRNLKEGDLLMLNLPHNPTGAGADADWLGNLCLICSQYGIRIFNDAAYGLLQHKPISLLAEVASRFPTLSWAEAYSASKLSNLTGWGVGAMIGSPDFIADIKHEMGEGNSGPNAALMHGVLGLCRNDMQAIIEVRGRYGRSLEILKEKMEAAGIRLAVEPTAGFFAFFDCPNEAFGQEINNAEGFNNLMIDRTGIVGVPFGKWIRYAVCKIDVPSYACKIEEVLCGANICYHN